jgi:predicted mannosyl-3-phosphoglycerate phosphatase (HAD superfamily)
MSSAVIYTDLDGTLLDHHTYAFRRGSNRLYSTEGARHTDHSLHEQNARRDR